jgi:uncharacterized protein (DUF2252 family)
MLSVDPIALARRQLARDREKTAHLAGIFEHKLDRMRASPLAFLRGTAPLYYELLEASPELARGPGGEGWLMGDLHLENFGAYRPQSLADEEDAHATPTKKPAKKKHAKQKHPATLVTFNLNDFDDAIVGPWRLDVMRLLVSLILGGRELQVRGARSVELCETLLDSYVAHACARGKEPPAPRPVGALVEAVRLRSRLELLDARTRVVHGARQFVRGDHYREVSTPLRKRAARAFGAYAMKVSETDRVELGHLEVTDVAYRVAGTGSLGGVRLAVLVRGKGGADGAWIFDMKEQGVPSGALLLGKPKMKGAKRVVAAMQACLEHPPRMLGTTKLDGMSMFVRRLAPQEDKLDLSHIREDDLESLAAYLGALTGAAHRRGATRPTKTPWKRRERDALLERAIAIAGIHEAAYLAYFKLAR